MILLELTYKLTRDEVEEALLCLNYKREGRFRKWNQYILTVLGIVLLVLYMKNPGQMFLFILMALVVLLLLYLTYWPERSRRRRAGKIARENGEYRLYLTDSYIIYGDKEQKLEFKNVQLKFFDSGHVYVLKAGSEVFTIPKRCLSEVEHGAIFNVIKKLKCDTIHIEMKE